MKWHMRPEIVNREFFERTISIFTKALFVDVFIIRKE